MKNLFSLTTDAFIYNKSKNANNLLGELIHQYIPLEGVSEIEFIYFKNTLVEKIKKFEADTDIENLANLTISLCDPYLKYIVPTDPQYNIKYITSMDILQPNEIESIQNNLYTDAFDNELKNLMILSYFYKRSTGYGKIFKKDFANYFYRATHDFEMTPTDEVIINRFLYDKIFKINSSNKPKKFLSTFLNYEKGTLIFDSWYDVQIILGLIFSDKKSKNPFVPPDKNTLTNINSFLNSFKCISLNDDLNLNILPKNDEKLTDLNIRKESIYIYNQFILERIGNFNFINCLYQAKKDACLPQGSLDILKNLVNCPLLNFRLNVINEFSDFYKRYLKNHPNFMDESNSYFYKLILHQIHCTIPIIDIVFHYLFSLVNDKQAILNSSSEYFKKLNLDNSMIFFEYQENNKNLITPKIYKAIYSKNDKEYLQLGNDIYSAFLIKSFDISENKNLGNNLLSIHYSQQEFLRMKLIDISMKYTCN